MPHLRASHGIRMRPPGERPWRLPPYQPEVVQADRLDVHDLQPHRAFGATEGVPGSPSLDFQGLHQTGLPRRHIEEHMGIGSLVQRLDVWFWIVAVPILEILDMEGGEEGAEVDDVRSRSL